MTALLLCQDSYTYTPRAISPTYSNLGQKLNNNFRRYRSRRLAAGRDHVVVHVPYDDAQRVASHIRYAVSQRERSTVLP